MLAAEAFEAMRLVLTQKLLHNFKFGVLALLPPDLSA